MSKKSSSSGGSVRIPGGSPEFELNLKPPWIVFTAEDSYLRPQYSYVTLKNTESVPIVYRIRTKDRAFPRFSHCHGYLAVGGSDEITVVVPTAEHWPRDPAEFAGKHHKVLIENLTVPAHTTPPNSTESASKIARIIFKSTRPLTRMYCKLNILLPKMTGVHSAENEAQTTA